MGKRKLADELDAYTPASGSLYPPPAPALAASPRKRQRKTAASAIQDAPGPVEEKRAARYRAKCPKNILERLERTMSQRFFLVDRERHGDEMRESFSILGSTGNVYTVIIDRIPSCSCPDAGKGNHCKHLLFVFLKVLGISQIEEVWYQKALLSSELEHVFSVARPNLSVLAPDAVQEAYSAATGKTSKLASPGKNGKDKGSGSGIKHPKPDDACAVCYEDMEGEMDELERVLIWCETCKKAIHKECFGQWTATARRSGADVTCVYCRSEWPMASAAASSSTGAITTSEGYLNLLGDLPRDESTYYHGPTRGSKWGRYY